LIRFVIGFVCFIHGLFCFLSVCLIFDLGFAFSFSRL
jgi:hypothetical protein